MPPPPPAPRNAPPPGADGHPGTKRAEQKQLQGKSQRGAKGPDRHLIHPEGRGTPGGAAGSASVLARANGGSGRAGGGRRAHRPGRRGPPGAARGRLAAGGRGGRARWPGLHGHHAGGVPLRHGRPRHLQPLQVLRRAHQRRRRRGRRPLEHPPAGVLRVDQGPLGGVPLPEQHLRARQGGSARVPPGARGRQGPRGPRPGQARELRRVDPPRDGGRDRGHLHAPVQLQGLGGAHHRHAERVARGAGGDGGHQEGE